jgi:hypothetical protein
MPKSADVTIITKWGSKKPELSHLVKGELAVDLVNHVLYTSDGNQIIEVGGGTIDFNQIINWPDEINNIINGTIDLDELLELAGDNADAILQLQKDLGELAARVTQNEKDIATNAGNIATNTTNIATNAGNISTNTSQIADNAADIKDNAAAIGALEPRVKQNEEDIAALQAIVDGDLTGLYLGGTYRLPANEVEDVTAAGTTAGIQKGDTLDQHAKDTNKGMYFVVEGTGTLGGLFRDSSNGQIAQNGDWLVCDGVHGWILMSFGGDHVAWGSIGGNIANQEDLMDELDKKVEEGDTLDGGRF